MNKLAIITTHPIQYNAPLFRLLCERGHLEIKVFYTWGKKVLEKKYDPGFNKIIEWDIPLLEGYPYSFIENTAAIPGSNRYNGIDNPTLVDEVCNWGANAILIFGWRYKSHLQCLNFFHNKIPVLFRGDSNLLDENNQNIVKRWIKYFVLKKVFKKIDVALYVGSANKSYFLKYGIPHNKLVFAPHAVDNERFQKKSKSSLREKLNIAKEELIILFAGKFEEKKNPVLLINAFIESGLKDWNLILVGNGVLEDTIKIKVATQKLAGKFRIQVLDFHNQSEMPGIYQACDIFVLPSKGPGETWGLAVNEAMACSKAIVVSDKCGCSEDLIKTAVNGFVFKSDDKNDLICKLKAIDSNKDLLRNMGIQSFEIIKNWNFEKICEAVETCLN